MPSSRTPPQPMLLRSARLLDVDTGEMLQPGELLVHGEHIVEVSPTKVPSDAVVVDVGDLTLLPGLMDMEVNLLLGGPNHASPLNAVQDDPALRTLRAVANARRTLRSGFTTVRNLGLFIQTGGLLLDVSVGVNHAEGHLLGHVLLTEPHDLRGVTVGDRALVAHEQQDGGLAIIRTRQAILVPQNVDELFLSPLVGLG